MNGLADQPGPAAGTPISYPFPSYDGKVTFTQEQWGDRTFDLNTDGLANYGMYADWLHDLQLVGGNQMMADMFQGAEAYLETWERADGVPATSCLPARARFSASGLGRRAAPRRHRRGRAVPRRPAVVAARALLPLLRERRLRHRCAGWRSVFNAAGQVALIATTAKGDKANGIGVGATMARLRARGDAAGPPACGRDASWPAEPRYVYGVRGGRSATSRWPAQASCAASRGCVRPSGPRASPSRPPPVRDADGELHRGGAIHHRGAPPPHEHGLRSRNGAPPPRADRWPGCAPEPGLRSGDRGLVRAPRGAVRSTRPRR